MKTIILIAAICLFHVAHGQKVYTKNGSVSFSKAPLENISAVNNQVTSVLQLPGGEMQFSVLIKAFQFKKSLMQEHFNENYLESNKYPKATFKGKITDVSKVNFNADGNYTAEVAGDLTIHGVTKQVTSTGMFSIKSGVVTATSKFPIRVADYNISIPKVVKDNISEVVEVSISCVYDQKI